MAFYLCKEGAWIHFLHFYLLDTSRPLQEERCNTGARVQGCRLGSSSGIKENGSMSPAQTNSCNKALETHIQLISEGILDTISTEGSGDSL